MRRFNGPVSPVAGRQRTGLAWSVTRSGPAPGGYSRLHCTHSRCVASVIGSAPGGCSETGWELQRTGAATNRVDITVVSEPEIIEPITALLVAGGVFTAAKFIVDLIDRLRGGLLIDLRPGARSLVARDRAVPFGWAVVVARDGRVKLETHDAPKDAAERLISQLISGVVTSAKDIAKAAKQELGDGKVEDAEDSPAT